MGNGICRAVISVIIDSDNRALTRAIVGLRFPLVGASLRFVLEEPKDIWFAAALAENSWGSGVRPFTAETDVVGKGNGRAREVIALTTEGASIRRPSGAVLRFPRPAARGVLLTEAAHV